MHGWIPEGVIPFGSVQNFLTPNQMAISKNRKKATEDNFCTVISQYSSCPITHVNFVLEPKGGHVDPFAENFNESFVERNLEKMFNIESLGWPNEDPVSDYDKEKIERFEKSIKHKDNCYYVSNTKINSSANEDTKMSKGNVRSVSNTFKFGRPKRKAKMKVGKHRPDDPYIWY